jgi:hypothetical protein
MRVAEATAENVNSGATDSVLHAGPTRGFPDDSRQWNVYGSATIVLDDGDLLLGGFFAIKRVNIGDGGGH